MDDLLLCMLFESLCVAYCSHSIKSNEMYDDLDLCFTFWKVYFLKWTEESGYYEMSPQMLLMKGFFEVSALTEELIAMFLKGQEPSNVCIL